MRISWKLTNCLTVVISSQMLCRFYLDLLREHVIRGYRTQQLRTTAYHYNRIRQEFCVFRSLFSLQRADKQQ